MHTFLCNCPSTFIPFHTSIDSSPYTIPLPLHTACSLQIFPPCRRSNHHHSRFDCHYSKPHFRSSLYLRTTVIVAVNSTSFLSSSRETKSVMSLVLILPYTTTKLVTSSVPVHHVHVPEPPPNAHNCVNCISDHPLILACLEQRCQQFTNQIEISGWFEKLEFHCLTPCVNRMRVQLLLVKIWKLMVK